MKNLKTELNYHGKSVFISGAAGGIGSALVKFFADTGYRVIAADIDKQRLSMLNYCDSITSVHMDVTNPEQINRLKEDLELEKTGLDILICAAGIYDSYPVTEANPGLFHRMMAVNLHGTANLVQGLRAPLVKNKGHVLVISSESYKIQALFQPYMISKAALEAYCRVARQELALLGVRLTVIRPGAINTPLLNWMKSPDDPDKYPVFSKEISKSRTRSIKMVGKIESPEKVARIIFNATRVKRPKRIYRVNNSKLLSVVSLLPVFLLDWLMIRMFRIKR